jgi:hypothetical protein
MALLNRTNFLIMQNLEDSKLLSIEMELEKKYPFFKKMDIYATVRNAYKKIQRGLRKFTELEFEEVKRIADSDLQLS